MSDTDLLERALSQYRTVYRDPVREQNHRFVPRPDGLPGLVRVSTNLSDDQVLEVSLTQPDEVAVFVRTPPELWVLSIDPGKVSPKIVMKVKNDPSYIPTDKEMKSCQPEWTQDVEAVLYLEARGEIGRVTRAPQDFDTSGRSLKSPDFEDTAGGKEWDVKRYNSAYPKTTEEMKSDISDELTARPHEGVILDTRQLTPADIGRLHQAVTELVQQRHDWTERIKWFPEEPK
jgi:hypothetical protein